MAGAKNTDEENAANEKAGRERGSKHLVADACRRACADRRRRHRRHDVRLARHEISGPDIQ